MADIADIADIWVVVGSSGKDLFESQARDKAQEWADREIAGGCYDIEHRYWDKEQDDFVVSEQH